MNVEEALMLLDRLCENDNSSNQTYEVDPVIALSSDATLSLSNLNSNPDKQTTDFNSDSHIESTIDSNNNLFNIEEPENLFESLEESSIEDPNDPDFNINEENGDSSDGEANNLDAFEASTATEEESLSENVQSEDTTRDDTEENTLIGDSSSGEDIGARKSRKRTRNEDQWKKNIRKRQRQSGKEYKDSKGNIQRKREIKNRKDCNGKCKFRCSLNITSEERDLIFTKFWNLSDDGKNAFYAKTTERTVKERVRTTAAKSRRKYSYRYFFVKGEEKLEFVRNFT